MEVRQRTRAREGADEGRALARTDRDGTDPTQVERGLHLCLIQDDSGTLTEERSRSRDGDRALIDVDRTSEGQRTATDTENAGPRLGQRGCVL